MRKVYMDHSATTPVREEVIEAMLPYFGGTFGNASSVHQFGRKARDAVEEARETIAAMIGASPDGMVFTSGGTESDNFAIRGVLAAAPRGRHHVITSAVEHHAVLTTCQSLENERVEVTVLPVDEDALVNPDDLRQAIRPETILVSIMMANNEVGSVQPIKELTAVARETGVPFHTDAVQAAGKIPVDVDALGVDLLSLSAHKFYGPKGVGALYVRPGTRMQAIQTGGHHEMGWRAGTENVPGVVGMARALELACEEMDTQMRRLKRLRDTLRDGLLERVPDGFVNGHSQHALPHLLNMTFPNAEGESLLLSLDAVGVAVSTGSACTSGDLEPSHVLTAMGIPPELAHGSLRFSLGRDNTADDLDYVLDQLPAIVERLRSMSPFAGGPAA